MLKNLTLFHLLLLATSLAFSGPVVPSGSILLPGQAAIASNSKYFAIMQSDGNFVMYRTADSAVRFATYQFGAYLAMQGDGNLVEYGSNQLPLWNTATNNNPGAFLVVQDDGNLVVYNAASKPLWNIGPDPGLDAPVNVGDVPARDLAYPVVGLLGHIGVWTGSKIAEMAAGSTTGNGARLSSWDAFRSASPTWATARPLVPNFAVYYCFATSCPYYTGSNYTSSVASRVALASRANQIYLIGADYTITAVDFPSVPSYPTRAPVRGQYRCDTFVVDVFQSTIGQNFGHPVPAAWQTRMWNLKQSLVTPSGVWNALKN